MKISCKGYIQRFLTQFHRNFKHAFLPQNYTRIPNFHLDTIGATLPQVPNTLGMVGHDALHNGTTYTGTCALSEFFTISLCKYWQREKKHENHSPCHVLHLESLGAIVPEVPNTLGTLVGAMPGNSSR